ncbi:MAG: nucleotidyl transferase AbiEii/AbiGii toxin family protein [Candidatus Atribacteria bacterium]|nr:nucleotidyl transferase AbiEii/AbiGii toxin family protein [Candidatus Atribacteria bacterium]
MKDYLLELASRQTNSYNKLNVMREYLQAYAIRVLFEESAFRTLAFIGGTALRFVHHLPRYSEDLDFSILKSSDSYSFLNILNRLKKEFNLAGFEIAVSYNDQKTVQSAFLKFPRLQFEAGISSFSDQNISVKIEVDTNPPSGAQIQSYIINKYFPLSFISYDIPSLFAGKIHALLSRKYTKGRDFYDLGWYLSRWKDITPNFTLLINALKQTHYSGKYSMPDNWRQILTSIIQKTNWKTVTTDIQNFLENPSDLIIFTQANLLELLKRQ